MTSPSSRTSGLLAAGTNQVVCGMKTRLNALTAISDGTNTATVTVYDNASTSSGTIFAKAVATANSGTIFMVFDNPVCTDNGITVTVAGTGSGAVIYYGA